MPISIVIVGVGNEDFGSMVRLDADELALEEGIPDIVQFVKYDDVIAKSEPGQAQENMSAVVLQEIPR